MASSISQLYQPLISRDIAAFPSAVRRFRKDHSATELFEAVARFAVLCYSPSQHGKHALIACLCAYQLRDSLGNRFEEVVTECAIYAALSRQPWSEPPMTDPPRVSPDHPFSLDEIRSALEQSDRSRSERWLVRAMREPSFDRNYFLAACDDLSDQGHKLIVANTVWELASLLGEEGRYATLRVAVWEWNAYREAALPDDVGSIPEPENLLQMLIERFVEDQGATLPFHGLVLFEAGLLASSRAGEPAVAVRVFSHLRRNAGPRLQRPSHPLAVSAVNVPVYRLARDYGQLLMATAIAPRLQKRFPAVDCQPILTAARYNLEHGPSFEEWSFA